MKKPCVHLYCSDKSMLSNFLNKFYNYHNQMSTEIFSFDDPAKLIDLISVVVDNSDQYNISVWVNLDEDIFIKVTSSNISEIIKYIYERYPI